MRRRTRTLASDIAIYDDYENPESAFDKVLNIQPDSTVKECKYILDSMRENLGF